MLTIQEITERLRNHYIGCSSASAVSASSSHKIRHRSEPAVTVPGDLIVHRENGHSAGAATLCEQDGAPPQPGSPRSRHAVLLPRLSCDVLCEDSGDDLSPTAAVSPGFCPPSKRHCRSLSIPADSYTSVDDWLAQHDLPRPVALRPATAAIATAATALPGGGKAMPGAGFFGSCFYLTTTSATSATSVAESPVPRPASVASSSGFFDGSGGSSSSASSLCWGGSATAVTAATSSCDSLACFAAAAPRARLLTGDAHSLRPRAAAGAAIDRAPIICNAGGGVQSAKSMPSMGCVDGSGAFSAPSSPKHGRPQRCRSQPCDLQQLQDRCAAGGLKRRREDQRPCLNFAKMTETAYERSSSDRFTRHKSFPVSVSKQHGHHQPHLHYPGFQLCGVGSNPQQRPLATPAEHDVTHHVLQTIASSPLDNGGFVLPASLLSSSIRLSRGSRDDPVGNRDCGSPCEESGEGGDGGSSSSSSSADSEYMDAPSEPFLAAACLTACDLDLDEIEQH